MHWIYVVAAILAAAMMFVFGFAMALVYFDNKIQNKKTVGELYITKPGLEPYFVSKVPMEIVANETYIMLEVRTVDQTQK